LIKESIDPDNTVLAEYDFDPLSSTGVLIDSRGVPLKFETYWDPDEDELDVERISDDGDWLWYGKYIYAGWLIHEAEGREPQDLVSALVPVIREVTTRFRDGHKIETSNRPPPYRLVSPEESARTGGGGSSKRHSDHRHFECGWRKVVGNSDLRASRHPSLPV
jgi:hypothetical protein